MATTLADMRERRAAARARMLRGFAFVTLSPLAFQLAAPLAGVLGIVLAKWSMTVTAIALAAVGTKHAVLGALDHYDAKRALPPGELPSARALPPRSDDS